MRRGDLYVAVDRLQCQPLASERVVNTLRGVKIKPSHTNTYHMGGKSSKDIYLEQKRHAEAMRLEFRL